MSDQLEATQQPGDLLDGRYRILSPGTVRPYGVVHIASDLEKRTIVHLLLLDPFYGTTASTLDLVAHTQRRVAALFQRSLVVYNAAGLAGGRIYLARRFVAGRTLASRLSGGHALPLAEAVGIAEHVCQALAPLHRAGLVHGALHPDHVLSDDDGSVLVTDAALLPSAFPRGVAPGWPWGPFPYVSPEQASGNEAGFASDIYGVGLLLYQMLAGRPPSDPAGEPPSGTRFRGMPVQLRTVAPHVPQQLADIVHQSLAREPSGRYRNAGQLAEILAAYARSGLVPPSRPMPGRPSSVESVAPAPRDRQLPAGSDARFSRGSVVAQATTRSPQPSQALPDLEPWQDEPGVDWFLVALLITAIVAVLGLIPLWWLAYQAWSPALIPPM